MNTSIKIFTLKHQLALHVAGWMTDLAYTATGDFHIALSGGSTPPSIFELLADDVLRARFPWDRVHWYWGDERFVPHDDPDSNYAMAWNTFLSKVPVSKKNIHPMPFTGTCAEAANEYEGDLKKIYGSSELEPNRPFFDINLLGIGPDGHTASIFPGSPVMNEKKAWVAAIDDGHRGQRVTLTLPMLASSRYVAFIVSGTEKAQALSRALKGDIALPAGRVRSDGDLVWFVDSAAATRLH